MAVAVTAEGVVVLAVLVHRLVLSTRVPHSDASLGERARVSATNEEVAASACADMEEAVAAVEAVALLAEGVVDEKECVLLLSIYC